MGLSWGHVNWETSRIEITDVKRGRTRIIPIFEELRPHLEAARSEAPEGAVYIIPSFQGPGANTRTRLLWTIKRAGLTPWVRPWQSLFSSRETELANTYPIQVVTAWIGNSIAVAKVHYLQVTDDHFKAAMGDQGGANMVQTLSDGADMVQSTRASKSTNTEKTVMSESDQAPESIKVPHKGFEPLFPSGKPDVLGH